MNYSVQEACKTFDSIFLSTFDHSNFIKCNKSITSIGINCFTDLPTSTY